MLRTYFLLLDSEEDNARFAELYHKNRSDMAYCARKLLMDDQLAEDAVSEAFFIFAKMFYRFRDKPDVQARNYLMTVTRNTALKMINKRKRETIVEDIDMIAGEPEQIENALYGKLICDDVFRIIKGMDPLYGDALLMKYQLGLLDREIALSLGVPLSTAKMRIFRGRKKLQSLMKEASYDRRPV